MVTDLQNQTFSGPIFGIEIAGAPRPDSPAATVAWRLNIRLLVCSLIAGGVLAPSLCLWYESQNRD